MNNVIESVAIELAARGLPPASRELFLQVADIGEVTINELAKLKGVHRTAIRVRLSRLEEAGLVEHIKGDAAHGRPPLKFRVRKPESSHQLLNETSSEIFLIDPKTQKFHGVSRGARENLGYTEEELLELGPHEISAEPNLDRFAAVFAQVVKGSGRCSYTGALQRKDGTVYSVEVDVGLIRDPEPTLLAAVTDISEQRALEADREQLATQVEASPQSMIVADINGTVTGWNRGAEVMTGHSASEAIGKNISFLTPPGLEPENKELTLSAIHEETIVNRETKSRRKDGTIIDIALSISPVRNGSGRVVALISSGTDITAQKEQQRASRLDDERLRLLFEDAQDPILVFQKGDWATLVDFNRTASEFFGYEPDELETLGYEDLLAPEELERAPIVDEALSEPGSSFSRERVVRKRDGTTATVEVRAKSLDDRLVMAVLRDITVQKEAEERLRQRDAWLTMLLEESPDAVIVADEDRYITDFNAAALGLLDRSSDSFRGTYVGDLYSAKSLARVPLGLEQVDAGETLAPEREIVRPDGRVVPVDVRVRRMSDGTVMSVLRDITERKSAEEMIRRGQASLTHAQLLAGVGSWAFDLDQQRFEWSGQIDAVFSTAMPKHSSLDEFLQLVHPLDRERARAVIEGFLTSDESFHGEFRIVRSDGSDETIRVWAEPESDEAGNRRRFAGAFQNVTVLRAAEQAALRSHERFQTMFEANPTPTIVVADQRAEPGIVLEANPAFLSLTGYSSSEIVGRTLRGLVVSAGAFDQLDADMESGAAAMGREVPIVCADGSERTVIAFREVIEIEGEECGLWSVVDITERRKLEGRLRRSERLEAMGQLAAGIAHDFNNILSVVLGSADYLLTTTDDGDPAHEVATEIHDASQRGADLVRKLLAFSRGQELVPSIVDAAEALEGLVKMLDRILGSMVVIRRQVAADLWPIFIDPGQFDQVVVNLVVNARDAMPGGGTISITLDNVSMDEQAAMEVGAELGEYVVLRVTDTGGGIESHDLEHLFEPFYTTKAPGEGTGLGLATVYGIVNQSAGQITVRSESGNGAEFSVYLPRASSTAGDTG